MFTYTMPCFWALSLCAAAVALPHFSPTTTRAPRTQQPRQQAAAQTVMVRTGAELRRAVQNARPGTRIELAPGDYGSGYFFTNVRGAAGRPIVVCAQNPAQPPVFSGGTTGALHFAGTEYLEVRDLRIEHMGGNPLALDDNGVREKPAHHLVVENVRFTDIGPRGNLDAIKLAGVDDFRITNCTFEGWSAEQGNAIDGVGCHRGIVEKCFFRDRPVRADRGSGAIQFKGASRDITIRGCRFERVGHRGINIGGNTGVPYFRPPLETWPKGENRYEAKNYVIEGNTFWGGGDAPVAFANTDGATVRFNTIYVPDRWALRILQENRGPGFGPSRGGLFTDNIIVFSQDKWGEGGVNIGAGTAPQTFTFARNFWFCQDNPARSRPRLPTGETGGVYGKAPGFLSAEKGDFRLGENSPAKSHGAHALPR